MSIRKFRWSKVYESAEEELLLFLRNRSIKATRITAEGMGKQLQQRADHDTTLWCADGTLTVRAGTTSVSLQPGDAVHISARTTYDLEAGLFGFVCYLSR